MVTRLRSLTHEQCSLVPEAGGLDVVEFESTDSEDLLAQLASSCDFVFHLAGVNRPKDEADFSRGNADLSIRLLSALQQTRRRVPALLSSSIQAVLDNPYGLSKLAAEEAFFRYAEETGSPVYVYRLPNAFGKWSRPNYNSAVATFCHNVARGLPIKIDDPEKEITLAYIDDIVEAFISALQGAPQWDGRYCVVPVSTTIKLGVISDLLASFYTSRHTLDVPGGQSEFAKKLYATYLSFLPQGALAYPLTVHADERGSFYEMMHLGGAGQISFNVTKPGITKGNHWHHTKNEKFHVISGNSCIRLRQIDSPEVIEYVVTGENPVVVDIPPGYTHSLTNVGERDLVTAIWANEEFDPLHPDTYYEEV